MIRGGVAPAGSGRVSRLDPFGLPVRFRTEERGADDDSRTIAIHADRVVIRRIVRGMRMQIELPVTAFRGVALWMEDPTPSTPAAITIVLEHPDPALNVVLAREVETSEVLALWKAWARVLSRPLLVAAGDGTSRALLPSADASATGTATRARRRGTVMQKRRPSILLRRKPGRITPFLRVHRNEREIIARN